MKILTKLLIGIGTIGAIVLIIFLNLSNKTLKERDREINFLQQKIYTDSLMTFSDLSNEFLTNGLQLPNNLEVECQNGSNTQIESLISGGKNIFLYLEQTYCSSCWGAILDKLNKEYPDITQNNLIVFCSFQNFREIVIYFKEMKINSTLVNLKSGNFVLPVCDANSPFLAIVDDQGRIENSCIIRSGKLNKVDVFINSFIKRSAI